VRGVAGSFRGHDSGVGATRKSQSQATSCSPHRLAGATNIASALRHHARDATRPLMITGNCRPPAVSFSVPEARIGSDLAGIVAGPATAARLALLDRDRSGSGG